MSKMFIISTYYITKKLTNSKPYNIIWIILVRFYKKNKGELQLNSEEGAYVLILKGNYIRSPNNISYPHLSSRENYILSPNILKFIRFESIMGFQLKINWY